MRKAIYKYIITITDRQSVLMPIGAKVLSVQFQGANLCAWALVDPDADLTLVVFTIVGTGNAIPSNVCGDFIGTAQQFAGQFVWHVFAGVEVRE